MDELNLEKKLSDIKQLCIRKIAKFRDFIHWKHTDKALNESWTDEQLPPDIYDDYKTQAAKSKKKKKLSQEETEKSPSASLEKITKKKKKAAPQTIYDKLRLKQKKGIKPKSFSQPKSSRNDRNIDPNVLTMDMSSENVARLSVDFYVKQIENNVEFIINNPDMEAIIRALYDDAARFHWCLKAFKLMYYFIAFAIFIISASGTNTPSERGIKAVKYYATPERNRMKGKALNALNHIHEKIIQDDFNEQQSKNSIKTAQACKTIMRAFAFHLDPTTKPLYQELIQYIKNKTRFLECGMFKNNILALIILFSET